MYSSTVFWHCPTASCLFEVCFLSRGKGGVFLGEFFFLVVARWGIVSWHRHAVDEFDCGPALAWPDGYLFQDLAGIGVKPHFLTGSGEADEHLDRINLAGRADGQKTEHLGPLVALRSLGSDGVTLSDMKRLGALQASPVFQ